MKRLAAELDRAAMSEIFFALCKGINSPVSLKCWRLYESGQHKELAEQRIVPSHYHDFQQFRDDYLVTSYLSKWKGLDTGIDREAVALEGFAASELKCKETNNRLRYHVGVKPDVESILLLAQQKIADILHGHRYSDAFEDCGWGKGATATIKGQDVTLVRKIDPGKTGKISVTRRALPYAIALLESDPAWFGALAHAEVLGPYSVVPSRCFEIVRGNRVTTVPKDATKDRTIAAEPTANIFLQLGVGRFLRKLLRRLGIDLDDQTQNQRYALIGSKTGEYATIDLKSASDTVCRELVLQLFPYDWSMLLDQLRSPEGEVGKGNWVRYEKFSSMGNGFTFELETLIFYAIAVATAQHHGHKGRILVYGDDIIFPASGFDDLKAVLEHCGFDVNTKKSYASGYFRESCGRHYWAGCDVTPIYQKEGFYEDRAGKERPRFLLQEAYRCANRLLRYAFVSGHFTWLDRRYYGAWKAARRVLYLENPKHVIPYFDEGDDGLLLEGEELSKYIHSVAKHGMVKLPVYSFVPKRISVPDDEQGTLYATWLRRHRASRKEFLRPKTLSARVVDAMCGVSPHYISITEQIVRSHLTGKPDIAYRIPVGRLGYYVSRRRMYPIGTPYVAWQ